MPVELAPAYLKKTRELIKKYDIKPNKALGQNFLVSGEAVRRIIEALEPDGRNVLEIGPGLGILTEEIAKRASSAAAVEIDASMVNVLRNELGNYNNLAVIHSDFLKVDHEKIREMLGEQIAVAGNLPYYITTPIATSLLTSRLAPETIVLTVQREAAQRFFARPGERVYGPLAALSQTAYDISPVMRISASGFYPAPEVDSAVVKLSRRHGPLPDMGAFSSFLQTAFSMRRKTLGNNLNGIVSREETARILESMGLPADSRAEMLSPSELAEFSARIGR
ncbi:MAG: Ribosomal RNA small subunit methyltransferase A [Firmicutes bacterium ADurb.Bin182]|nr:MAG: Ribosomal RNA small subunit methyltransferase A [Firmicutes bacterium ADurb.Bin182]